jgi:hypothetical protein
VLAEDKANKTKRFLILKNYTKKFLRYNFAFGNELQRHTVPPPPNKTLYKNTLASYNASDRRINSSSFIQSVDEVNMLSVYIGRLT